MKPLGNRARSRSAFTLIEVLVVIVIIALLSAAVVPMFGPGIESARTRAALDRVTNMMSLSSSMAAADGQTYKLLVDQESDVFQIMIEEEPVEAPGKFSEMRLSDLSFFRLEEGIALRTVTVEGHDEESGELPTIDFYSDGTATRAALVFETPGGATWTVTVTPMTSALRVYDFDIAEREEMQ